MKNMKNFKILKIEAIQAAYLWDEIESIQVQHHSKEIETFKN